MNIFKRLRHGWETCPHCNNSKPKFSLREVAKKTGLSNPYLCQIEKTNKEITIRTLTKIAKGYKVDLKWLFEEYCKERGYLKP